MVRSRSSSVEGNRPSAPSSPSRLRVLELTGPQTGVAGAHEVSATGATEGAQDALFVGPPSHFKSMPKPSVERSSTLEVFIALITGCMVVVATLGAALALVGGRARIALSALWCFQLARMHVEVWWLGGWKGFMHLCRRFPHAWIWTVTTLVPFTCIKFAQWLLVQLLLFDSIGKVFRVDGSGVTMVRWWRMAIDLNKPLSRPPRIERRGSAAPSGSRQRFLHWRP